MPEAVMDFDGKVVVMQSSMKPSYYNHTKGERILTKRCVFLTQNTGIVFVPDGK